MSGTRKPCRAPTVTYTNTKGHAMEMQGEQNVPLSQDKAWEALNDPEVLAACVPGCESMEQVDDNQFKARVKTSVGPVSAQFKGKVKLSDVTPPESYKLSFKGDGNAGFVQGTADVRLTPTDAGTRISYDATAKVGGKLAQVGSRLIDGAAQKMADEFFANLTTHMGGTPTPAADDAPPTDDAEPSGLWAMIRSLIARLLGR